MIRNIMSGGIIILLAVVSIADDAAALLAQASAAYRGREYARSAQLYEAAIKAGISSPTAPYNAACCFALLGKTDDAFVWLDKAIDAGWRDVEHLKADTDFESLHDDPRWEASVKRCTEKRDEFVKSLKEPALREELLKRLQEDQRIRMTVKPGIMDPKTAAEWHRIDGDNTAFMKTVIEKHGCWPGKSMVGADGAQAAFLLVQHADADPAFQKKCLELMTRAVEQGEARAADLAYLTDRVLVAEGKPQRYGTQFHTVGGELKPKPIEDEANVDARRKEVGLPPLADYVRQMREMQGP